ncbi:MAG: hypothetical protein ACJ758_02195 [Actinomycetota bacterium]
MRWRDGALLVGIAAGISFALLIVYLVRDFRFPLGADAPVYLWWARLASVDRLSSVGTRPGVPALLLVLSGTLHAPLAAVVAALEAVLAGILGLGAWTLLQRSRKRRGVSVLAAFLTGAFAVNLAVGYLASLTFAALFLAGAAVLVEEELPRRRGAQTVAAAALLGAAALAHPLFSVVGAAILVATMALAYREHRRGLAANPLPTIGGALLGAAAILGAGLLALVPGPAPLDAITSKDGFLRKAGLHAQLSGLYAERLRQHWARYVSFVSLPLAIAGLWETEQLLREFLFSWLCVTIVGVVVGLGTGVAPADRFVSFAFCVPILAALGVVVVRAAFRSRNHLLVMNVVSVALVAAMVAGPALTWSRQQPYVAAQEVEAAQAAGEVVGGLAQGTPLVFIVDSGEATAGFLAPRAENVIRAAMPPDRIADVHVFVGTLADEQANRPTVRGDPQFDSLSRTYLQAIHSAEARTSERPATFVLQPFAPSEYADAKGMVLGSRTVLVRARDVLAGPPRPVPYDTLDPASPALIAATALGILALLFAVGFGWARAVLSHPVQAFGLAPAFGAAALMLGAVVAEPLGVALTGAGPPIVSAVVAAGGYALWWWHSRRFRRHIREQETVPQSTA